MNPPEAKSILLSLGLLSVVSILYGCQSHKQIGPPLPPGAEALANEPVRAFATIPADPPAFIQTNRLQFWNRTNRYAIDGSTNLTDWYPVIPVIGWNEPDWNVWTAEIVRTNYAREFFRMRVAR